MILYYAGQTRAAATAAQLCGGRAGERCCAKTTSRGKARSAAAQPPLPPAKTCCSRVCTLTFSLPSLSHTHAHTYLHPLLLPLKDGALPTCMQTRQTVCLSYHLETTVWCVDTVLLSVPRHPLQSTAPSIRSALSSLQDRHQK